MQSNQKDSQPAFKQSLFVATAARLATPSAISMTTSKQLRSPKVAFQPMKPSTRQHASVSQTRIQMSATSNDHSSRVTMTQPTSGKPTHFAM